MRGTVTSAASLLVITLSIGVRVGSAQNPMVDELKSQWEASRKQMVQIAEAMPADKFQYRPTPEVRSFGEIVAHVAGENTTWMEILAGVAKPGSVERFNQLKSRQEVLKALSDLYDYGAKVIANLNDQKATESIPFNRRQRLRWAIVTQAIGHSKEHYGNLVTYLRLSGIVPPSTASSPGGGA
jgi:uncharacterized damage-inducible protein DinB